MFTDQNSSRPYFKELGLKIPIQKIVNDKCYILCSKCPPPEATHDWSLFRHSPTALLIMRWSSLSHSSAIRRRSSSLDILTACLVNPFLQYAPDPVVHWVEIGANGWPQIWWNEVWRLDFQEFDSFASPMHWGSVLRIIDKAFGEWRKRLQACVAAGGGHFEHKM